MKYYIGVDGGGGIGLNGVALIEETALVEAFEKPPEALDITIVVGDVGIVHVDPVAHLVREVAPEVDVLHDLAAASGVILVDRDFGADVLLGDAEHLLDTELHREAVGVPSCFADHTEAALRLISAERILDGTRHHVVNTGFAVGRWRAVKENEIGMSLPLFQTVAESVFLLPLLGDFLAGLSEVKSLVLGKSLAHECLKNVMLGKLRLRTGETARRFLGRANLVKKGCMSKERQN